MTELKMERDWTPVRRGAIYCSPSCGANCTYEEYQTATNKAKVLAERCAKEIGGEWDIHVNENLGWHWCVFHKKTNISIRNYVYSENDSKFSVGLGNGTPVQISLHPQTFDTPKEAFEAQVKAIQREADRWNEILNNVKH